MLPDPTWLQGCDLSHYQGHVDFGALAAAGVGFVMIKCSEATSPDPLFEEHWSGAKSFRLARSAYHFWHPDVDAQSQMDFFLGRALADPGELPETLDVERGRFRPLAVEDAPNLQACLDSSDLKAGRESMIYTSHIMWLMLGDPKGFAGRPLWLARYAPDPGVVPGDFGDWEFWQATQNGTVPGVQGPVDRNYFHGTAPDLKTRFGL